MSDARRIGELLPDILLRAQRTALIGKFIETFEAPDARKRVVMLLFEANILSADTAELMIEHYGLEAA